MYASKVSLHPSNGYFVSNEEFDFSVGMSSFYSVNGYWRSKRESLSVIFPGACEAKILESRSAPL